MARPTYILIEVIRLSKTPGARNISGTAESDARDGLGLDREGIFRLVASLKTTDFYKSMPSTQRPGTFQDVYRPLATTPLHQRGIVVYCKVQIVSAALVVISCKQK